MPANSANFERDAQYGNARIHRAEFIREEMRQTGCLAIEAARAWARLNPAEAKVLGMDR